MLLNGCNCASICSNIIKVMQNLTIFMRILLTLFLSQIFLHLLYPTKLNFRHLSCKLSVQLHKHTYTHKRNIHSDYIVLSFIIINIILWLWQNILLQNRLMSFNKWINFIYCSPNTQTHRESHCHLTRVNVVPFLVGLSCLCSVKW